MVDTTLPLFWFYPKENSINEPIYNFLAKFELLCSASREILIKKGKCKSCVYPTIYFTEIFAHFLWFFHLAKGNQWAMAKTPNKKFWPVTSIRAV